MKAKVVIAGHSFTSRLSIIRSVAAVSSEITVIDMRGENVKKDFDCYSKYVTRVFFCNRRNSKGLVDLLLSKCKDDQQKVILIPDSDFTAAVIDANHDVLEKYFVFPHIVNTRSNSVEYWMDKMNQKGLALEVGLNVAKAVIAKKENGTFSIPSNVSYPCFFKPLMTMTGGKAGMRKCVKDSDVQQSFDFINDHKSSCNEVLLEEYKEIETEYALLGFSDGKTVIIPAILELLVISKVIKGIALQGKIMPTTGFEDLIEKFKLFVLKMGFIGIFDIDFFKCNGKFYFCEMNLRFGGSGYAVTKMGVNLPEMMVRYFMGEKQTINDYSITGTSLYVNERMNFGDYENGAITYDQYKDFMTTSNICFIDDAEDPDPAKQFKKMVLAYRLRRFIKSILHIKS